MKNYYTAPEAELIRFQAAQAVAADDDSGVFDGPAWAVPEEDKTEDGD